MFRIRIVRAREPRRNAGRRSGAVLTLSGLAALTLTLGAGALPASAADSGSVAATINVGSSTLSLTVSPSSFSYCSPTSPLSFPNGLCYSDSSVTVTMGNVGGHVDINGADAVPSGGAGTPWTLCGGSNGAPACDGSAGAPGQDEYSELTTPGGQTFLNGYLANTPGCDINFGGSTCVAGAGQSESETFMIQGPSSSSSASSSFSTSITWTALP
jgi:hypothetical protein